MTKFYTILKLIVAITFTLQFQNLHAQCTPCGTVTTIAVDLTANPDTVWSIASTRNGLCCGNTGTRCIRFDVTINSQANEISFNAAVGNAGTYQIDCQGSYNTNSQYCIPGGVTSFCIVYCKEGGDAPTYTISTSQSFEASPDITVSSTCTGELAVAGLQESTITWNSIAPGAVGDYNNYLNCTAGCDTVLVNAQPGYPTFVDYLACGTAAGCATGTVCDTVRVNFVPGLELEITPVGATICSGNSVTLTANVTGGSPPYSYLWNTGATTPSILVTSPGTYDVTVTDGTLLSCPPAFQSIVVGAAPIPSDPTILSNSPLCIGATLNLSTTAVTGAIYNWTGPNGFTSNLQNPSITNVSSANSGTYSLSITVDGCTSNVVSTSVIISPAPLAPTAGSNSAICSGQTLNLTATTITGATYSWTGPNGFTNNTQNPSIPSATIAASGTYSVTATVNGCTGPAGTTVVTVNAIPLAPTAGSNSAICSGQTLNLTATTITGATYSWTGPNGFTNNTQNPSIPSATVAASGTYSVTATVNGCTGPAGTTAVTVNPSPLAPTAGSNSAICSGQTLNLTATTITGATYSWTGPNGFTNNTQNPSIPSATVAASGTYSVTATVNGCTGPAGTTAVTVNAIPLAPTAGSNSAICSGQTLNLTATTITGATYSWTGPNGFTNNTQNPSIPSATVAASGTYSVTATVNGCTSPAGTTAVTVNAIPLAPTAGSNSAICAGQTLNLTATTITGATYSWTGPNGFTNNTQNPSIPSATIAASGTYSVTTTVNGCTGPAGTTVVTVNAIPLAPTAGSNSAICSGQTLNLTATTITGATYSWTGPNGFTNNTQNPSIPSATVAASGTYSVTATVNGCTGPAGTTAVTVNPSPLAPTAGSNSAICSGQTLNLTATTITGATYSWTGPNGFTNNTQNPSIPSATVAASGTYSVTATVNGCTGPAGTTAVTVNAIPLAPTAGSNSAICSGQTLNLTATTITGATYSWTGPNGFTNNTQNPSIPSATVAASGTYSVTATVNGCTGPAGTTAVTVNAIPLAPTAGSNSAICSGQTLNLTATTITGATYSWTGPNGFTNNTQNPSIPSATVAASGTYSVTATVNGCTGPAGTTAVTVNAIPVASTAGSNSPLCSGNTINLTATSVTGATYNWTGPNSFSASVQNPTISNASLSNSGTYSLTVTVNGCTSPISSTVVTVNETPSAPSLSSNSPICAGQTLNLNASLISGATYSWTGPNSFISSLQNPSISNVTVAATGTYGVTATVNGCSSPTASITITINSVPAAPTPGANTPLCEGSNLNLTATTVTGASYTWVGPDGFSSIIQNTSINGVTTLATGTYGVTATVNNCTSSVGTVEVTVNPIPSAPSASGITICQGNTTTLTAIGSGGTYQWYSAASGGTLLGSNASYTTPVLSNTTTYYVQNTVLGCTSSRTPVTVTVNPIPAAPSVANATICEGFNTTLTATAPGGNYTWTDLLVGGNTLSILDNYTTPNLTNTTSYFVTTIIDGCTSPVTEVTVTVTPTDDAGFSYSSNTFCITGTNPSPIIDGIHPGVFSATPLGLIINSSTGLIDLVSSTLGTYIITYATAGPCPTSTNTSVTITNAPDATFSYNSPICSSSGNILPNFPSGSSAGVFSSTLGLVFANTSTGEVNVSGSTAGTYTVTNIIVAADGCAQDEQTATLTIEPAATVNAGVYTAICEGNNLSVSGTIGGSAASAVWSGAGTFGNPNNLNTIYTPTAAEITAGLGTVTLTTNSPGGVCPSESHSATFTITPLPSAPTANGTTICEGNSTVLTATAPGGTYRWYAVPSGGTILHTGANFTTPVLNTTTTYYVSTTISGCPGPRTPVTVTIILNDDPSFSYSSGTYCVTGSSATPAISGLSGGVFTSSPSGLGINAGSGTIDPTSSALNTYSVTYTTNGFCPQTESVNITITIAPDATFSYDGPYCQFIPNTQPSFPGGSSAGVFSVSPSGLNLANASTGELDLSTASSGVYNVTNFIAAADGCASATYTSSVTIEEAALAFAGPDQTLCIGESVSLSGSFGGSASSASWTGNGGTFSPSASSLNSTYSPSAAEYLAGTTELTLITNAPGGICLPGESTVTVTFTQDDPSFAYGSGTYCITGTNPTPTITGGFTGVFTSSPSGLSFVNTTTGQIDLAGSTMGAYTVVYTTNGPCPAQSSQNITITDSPNAEFTYPAAVCETDVNVLPNFVSGASAGVFTSTPSGLVFVSNGTGEIDMNLSVSGSYSVTNFIAAASGCASASHTTNIVINEAATVEAGSTVAICEGQTALLNGSIGGSATSATWSGGLGTFANASSLSTTYTPGISETSVKLYLTTNNPSGSCSAAIDSVIITIKPLPDLPTSADVTVCEGSTALLTATAPSGSGFQWFTQATGGVLQGSGVNYTTPVLVNNTTYYVQSTLNGCVSDGRTPVLVNVTEIDDPSFSYSSSTYCITGSNPTAIVSGGSGGTFSSVSTGLIFADTSTGEIDILASALGTYTVDFVTSGFCPDSSSASITITEAPDATFSYNTPFCTNGGFESPQFPIGSSAGIFSSNPLGVSFVNTASGEIDLSATAPGVYTILNDIAANGGCAPASYSSEIEVLPGPTVFAGNDVIVCTGELVSLNTTYTNAGGVEWSTGGDGVFDPVDNSSITGYAIGVTDSTLGLVTLYITTTNNGLCASEMDSLEVTINPQATADAGSNQNVCIGEIVNLNGTIGGSASSAIWSGGNGSFANNTLLNTTYTPDLSETSVTLYLTSDDPMGPCNAVVDSVIITINPLPDAPTADNVSVCSGTSAELSAIEPLGATFNWFTQLTGGTSQGTGTIFNTPALTATTSFFLQATVGGCNSAERTEIIVTVLSSDDSGFDYGLSTFCTSGLNPSPIINSGSTGVFSSIPGDVVFVDVNTGEIDVATTPLGTYIIRFVTSGICADSTDVSITITDTPNAEFSYSDPFCTNSGDASPQFVNGASAGSFTATPSGLVFVSASSGVINLGASQPGIYTIVNDIPASGGCVAANFSTDIEILPSPTVDAGIDMTVCENNAVANLNATFDLAGGILWTSSGDGAFNPLDTDPMAFYTPGIDDLNSGFVVLYIATTSNGLCNAEIDSVRIDFTSSPLVDAGNDIQVCDGASFVNLNATITGGASSGEWTSSGNGTFSDPNSLSTTYTFSTDDELAQSVTLYIETTDQGSCLSVMDSVQISIGNNAIASVMDDFDICVSSGEISITGTITGAFGTGIWSTLGDGSFITTTDELLGQYLPGADEVADGSIVLVLEATNSCVSSSDTLIITLLPDAQSSAGNNQTLCAYNVVNLTGNISNANGGTWMTNGDGNFSPDNQTLVNTYALGSADVEAGSVTLYLIAESLLCLNDTSSLTITIAPLPIAEIITSEDNCAGSLITFTDNSTISSGSILGWNWTIENDIDTLENTTYTFAVEGTYEIGLLVTSDMGCTDSVSVSLSIENCDDEVIDPRYPAIPDAFTPNADGINDILYVRGGPFNSMDFRVFNEWGNQLFISNDQDLGWDGRYKDKLQSQGVYVWTLKVVTLDNEEINLSGEVTIIK
jgi:gliding motility-associated-like protein